MQFAQRCHGHPRVTGFHPRAHDRIKHPARYYPDYTSTRFNMDHAVATSLFNVSNLDSPPIQWVPTIMDFHVLPDMGRMNGQWSLRARASCSQIRLPAHMPAQISLVSLKLARPMVSIHTVTWPGCSSACLWQRPPTTTRRLCLGGCRPPATDSQHIHSTNQRACPPLRGTAIMDRLQSIGSPNSRNVSTYSRAACTVAGYSRSSEMTLLLMTCHSSSSA
jgi:hypothetical protein